MVSISGVVHIYSYDFGVSLGQIETNCLSIKFITVIRGITLVRELLFVIIELAVRNISPCYLIMILLIIVHLKHCPHPMVVNLCRTPYRHPANTYTPTHTSKRTHACTHTPHPTAPHQIAGHVTFERPLHKRKSTTCKRR